ncbi:MAG: GtrA family protein [Paludibacter sp.]|jgi:putative flippase GtrA|nr:GtrA family protein [Paludibacter sp.]
MRKFLENIGQRITVIIDFFYPPFSRIMTRQIFRYGVTGTANMVFDWVLYFLIYHFALHQQILDLGFVAFSSHIASLILVFPITFISGFLLQKYVTFTTSHLKGKVQIIRYLSTVAISFLITFFGLKLFVDVFHVFPTPSKVIVTIFSSVCSYLMQRNFTFGDK